MHKKYIIKILFFGIIDINSSSDNLKSFIFTIITMKNF